MRDAVTTEEQIRKAEQLNNSRPLDVWRISQYPEVKSVVHHIFSEMEAAGIVRKRYAEKLRRHVQAIVLDLFVAHRTDPVMYISYSRNKNDFKAGSRYRAVFFGYSHTLETVDFLKANGYIEHVAGYHGKTRSRQSRMRATNKLIGLIEDHYVEQWMLERDEDEPIIILKDKKKRKMEYEETAETIQMKENLKKINRGLKKHAIHLYIPDEELKLLNERLKRDPEKGAIDFTQKRLKRVFNNGSFKQGGRFYGGWWQNIPREYRQWIRINTKHVSEIDYSGLHINMLYALEGLPLPKGDVYHIDGYSNDSTFRAFLKRMLLIMVNSSDREAARKALHSEVHLDKGLKLPTEIRSTKKADIYPLMDAFENKHRRISKYFCSGKGVDLQYYDSQLAEKVMLKYLPHSAILPVHDSFIIHHGLKDYLERTMKKAFRELFGVQGKVSLKFDTRLNSLEKIKEEEKRSGNPDQLISKIDIGKLFEDFKVYSTFHRIFDEHLKREQIENLKSLEKKIKEGKADPESVKHYQDQGLLDSSGRIVWEKLRKQKRTSSSSG
jgi:hypothetical protein